MGLPLYKSPSSEALRRQAEVQAAAQAAARRSQAAAEPHRARSGAPPPLLRREDAQRRAFSGPTSAVATGTQESPTDLTRPNLEVEAPAQRRPAPPPRFEAPIPTTEDMDVEMEDSDGAASAALSRYSRTRFDSSELATPTEEEEIRLPNYGTPDVGWSIPEIEAASTPLRAAQSSTPRAAPAPQHQQREQRQQRQQPLAGPPQGPGRQDDRHLVAGRAGFVEVIVDQNHGPVVQVQGGEQAQSIPPSLRLPPLPRPSDTTIRDPRRRGLRLSNQGSSGRQSSGSHGSWSSSGRSGSS
ncbi:hypothetical protein QBC32DRAFT_391517 [Pseudoneurospora amorphoporcata]|uniref:Uncharacterized protein n=1 Tax=Pseudoneurospora amorphoporcata TaxID=241081 RepID=A0AAN6NTM4_9PEZI|nr:hypothetical protein QBC32DRAFT_391517 [Pseudoneurospora amorphoporcata]